MAIFVTDEHKGCTIGRGYTIISCFETVEKLGFKRRGVCLAKRDEKYGVILYDPDHMEDDRYYPCDWGEEQKMWSFYWRRVVGAILNQWNRAHEEVQNEGASRDETLQH